MAGIPEVSGYMNNPDESNDQVYLDDTVEIVIEESDVSVDSLSEHNNENGVGSSTDRTSNVTSPCPSTSGTSNKSEQLKCEAGSSISRSNELLVEQSDSKNQSKASEIDEEAECCPICFEPWTNSGDHRLSSLKCGHLFGQSCIEKWLAGQGGKCPHCNSKATKKDIRVIYAKALKMSDTSEKDQALSDLEKEREARRKAELKSAETNLQYQMAIDEVNKLKAELENFRSNVNMSGGGQFHNSQGHPKLHLENPNSSDINDKSYILDKTFKISEIGGCRVMAYSHHNHVLCLSQPSSNQLFPGFGVKKLSTLDFKTSQFISVHSKPIRDLSFNYNNPNGFMLSCSVDKTVKVTSLNSNTVVQSYNSTVPVWSCAWNMDDFNYLYAGQQNGTVLVFDMRNTSQSVQQFNTEGSRSPVLSLHYVPDGNNTDFSCSGVLVGQLERCSFFEKKANGENKVHVLPVDGSLTSLHFEDMSQHMLVTFRPNVNYPSVRHAMYKLLSQQLLDSTVCTSRNIHTFHGGRTQKLLSKNKLLPYPNSNGNLLICACDEASQSVLVWNATTGTLKQKLPSNAPVMDLCQINNNQTNYLVALTEKQAAIYKWR